MNDARRATTNRGWRRRAQVSWPATARGPVAGLVARARAWTAVRYARRYLIAHQGGDLAAGIAFHALLYLFPLLGAILAILGAVLRNDALLLAIGMRVVRLFPGTWEVPLRALLEARDHAGWVGLASLLGLPWLGSSLLGSLARAFDRLYGVPSRHPVRQRFLSLALILGLAVLLSAAIAASAVAHLLLGYSGVLLQRIGVASPLSTALSGLLALALGLLAAFALFLMLYWRLPHVRQGYRDIWRGAALAAALLVAVTQLFPLYARFAPTGRYGSLLGFSLLLATWLYLLAHITLVGAAVNAYRRRRWLPRPLARRNRMTSCERPPRKATPDSAR